MNLNVKNFRNPNIAVIWVAVYVGSCKARLDHFIDIRSQTKEEALSKLIESSVSSSPNLGASSRKIKDLCM